MPRAKPRSLYVPKPVPKRLDIERIRALKCFDEVHDRLVLNWPLEAVANFIQSVRREAQDVPEATLIDYLVSYRRTIPKSDRLKRSDLKANQKAYDAVVDSVDELAEMERLYWLQLERIKIDFETEKKIKKLLPTMTNEVRAAREILNNIAQVKMDLGLSARHLGQVNLESTHVQLEAKIDATAGAPQLESAAVEPVAAFGQAAAKVLQNPESRRRILGIVHRLVSNASEEPKRVIEAQHEVAEVVSGDVSSRELVDDALGPDDEDELLEPVFGTEDAVADH